MTPNFNLQGTDHTQLHASYSSLGKDFKGIFEDLVKHMNSQREEAESLRAQVAQATGEAIESEKKLGRRIDQCLDEERQAAASDRHALLSQITELINANGATQEERVAFRFDQVRQDMMESRDRLETAVSSYAAGMDAWSKNETAFQGEVFEARDTLKAKLKKDWTSVSEHNAKLQTTAKSIHGETVRIVDKQVDDMAIQMQALDRFVSKAHTHNDSCHDSRVAALDKVVTAVHSTHTQTKAWLDTDRRRLEALETEIVSPQGFLEGALKGLEESICAPLVNLRETALAAQLQEYRTTGETPQKVEYSYPLSLPRTEPHEQLLGRTASVIDELPDLLEGPLSPSKAAVFTDGLPAPAADTPARPATTDGSLREITTNPRGALEPMLVEAKTELESLSRSAMAPPPLKRHATENSKVARGRPQPTKLDRENLPFSSSLGGVRRLRSSPHSG